MNSFTLISHALDVLHAGAIIALAALGLFRRFRKTDNRLNKKGKWLFAAAVICLIISVIGNRAINQAREQARTERAEKRIEELNESAEKRIEGLNERAEKRIRGLNERIDTLIKALAAQAQTTPAAPSQPPPSPTDVRPQLISPADGAIVDDKVTVSGTSFNGESEVWVIVHPQGTSSYWVQPRVALLDDGNWTTQAYFGRPGAIDTGKQYEVIAVVGPAVDLYEGRILSQWPIAKFVSETITLTRN